MSTTDYRVSHVSTEKSKRYEYEIYRSGSYDDYLWKKEQELLKSEIEELEKKVKHISYLDFACGTGRIIKFVKPFIENTVGVDISASMLEIARKKLPSTTFICGDLITENILKNDFFDLITAFRFFLNAQAELRSKALSMLVRKLRDEDSVFIFNFHGNIMSYRAFTKLWYFFKGRKLHTASIWEARRLAKAHKLTIQRWYGFGIIPKICYRYINPQLCYKIDNFLSSIPLSRHVSYNLIFVCKKINIQK